MKNFLIAFVLAAIALAPIFYIVYYGKGKLDLNQTVVQAPPDYVATFEFETKKVYKFEPGAQFAVQSCKIKDGHIYSLLLENDQWIDAYLTVVTKDEAVPFVVDLFKTAQPPAPTATLRRKVGSTWVVDLSLTVDGKRVELVTLLREKGLLLN